MEKIRKILFLKIDVLRFKAVIKTVKNFFRCYMTDIAQTFQTVQICYQEVIRKKVKYLVWKENILKNINCLKLQKLLI